MTAHTPVYGLEYITEGEPARNARAALENNAHTIEAALIAGGIAPAGAPDIATLSGRVSQVETPMFGEYGCTQTSIQSAIESGITTLTKINQVGFDATVSANFLQLPPGLWHFDWAVTTSPTTVTGRNFLAAVGGPDWSKSVVQRRPWATIGEDTGGTSFLLPLTTTTGVALSIFTTTAATYTAKHRIRVTRVGTIPAP